MRGPDIRFLRLLSPLDVNHEHEPAAAVFEAALSGVGPAAVVKVWPARWRDLAIKEATLLWGLRAAAPALLYMGPMLDDAAPEPSFWLLAMSAEGASLEDTLAARCTPLPAASVLRIAWQLLHHLRTLHTHCGYAWLDLKPRNMLLSRHNPGRLLLIDFEAAAPIADACAPPPPLLRVPRRGGPLPRGWACYAGVHGHLHHPPAPRDDLESLGYLLLQLLGWTSPPWVAHDAGDAGVSQQELRVWYEGVSDEQKKVLKRCCLCLPLEEAHGSGSSSSSGPARPPPFFFRPAAGDDPRSLPHAYISYWDALTAMTHWEPPRLFEAAADALFWKLATPLEADAVAAKCAGIDGDASDAALRAAGVTLAVRLINSARAARLDEAPDYDGVLAALAEAAGEAGVDIDAPIDWSA